MPLAYSRADPRYRRLYAAKDMRRRGCRKFGERLEGGVKLLVYRRRCWNKDGIHRIFYDIYPDGTIKERHTFKPKVPA